MSSKKSKDFYVWIMDECIKSTYEYWGTDMMSMYRNIKRDFPNATEAIEKIYDGLSLQRNGKVFEDVQYVYEAIANLVPQYECLYFDIRTKELSHEYKKLNMCSWGTYHKIKRIDLLMAVLLFTEEFILQPISGKNIILTDNKLSVYSNFITLKVSQKKTETYISIRIKDVILFEYVIQN